MLVYALVIWFGSMSSQTTFSVSNIVSLQECERLGKEMTAHYGRYAEGKCFPYHKAK